MMPRGGLKGSNKFFHLLLKTLSLPQGLRKSCSLKNDNRNPVKPSVPEI